MNQNQWTAFKDITAGSVGGMFGTFLGQPADVVKTRMQTASLKNPLYTSNLHCMKQIVSKEGIHGFFKGITPPLLSSIPINAIIFPVQHIALNYISGSERKPNGIENALAGGVAGFVQAPIASVNELLKIQLQSNHNKPIQGKSSITQQVSHLLATQGIRNGLFRGLSLTIVRDVPGFSIYFYAYDVSTQQISLFRNFMRELHRLDDIDPNEDNFMESSIGRTNSSVNSSTTSKIKIPAHNDGFEEIYDSMASFVGGGIAGVLSWLFTLPIDCLKTIVQAPAPSNEGNRAPNMYTEPRRSAIAIARSGYNSNGLSFFFRGVKPTLIRAFFVNAGVFVGYEFVVEKLNLLDDHFDHEVEDIEF